MLVMTTTNTNKGTFTFIVQTRSGRLPGNNRDRGNLLPIFFVLVTAGLLLVMVIETRPEGLRTIVRTQTPDKKKSRDGKDSRLFFHALTLTGGVAILGL